MIGFNLEEIASVLDAELVKGVNFTNQKIGQIVIDSRIYFKDDDSIFFALNGPRNNGHSYIPNLMEKGISAFVVSDKSVISQKATFILVENTTAALQKLAAFNRLQQNYPVIGITGSNGKTIVKEWLHNILSGEFKIVRNPKSYNSQVGVPLSVLLMDSGFDLGIFEAGISQPGEMKNLAEIIQPTIGIFTNIGDAHQEDTNCADRGDQIQAAQQSPALLVGKPQYRKHQPYHATMEGHAAIQRVDDLARILKIIGQVVKQHVAGAAADDDGEHGPEGKVPDILGREGRGALVPEPLVAQQQIAIAGAK